MTPINDTKDTIKIKMWHLPMISKIQETTSKIQMWHLAILPKIQQDTNWTQTNDTKDKNMIQM